ncbi:hypothetical protein QCD60_30300 [Pokkaliibacter sp. MBI-7]|uniref:hypothetical protein n=1 Tax=Pokkaliibacter sp. MBI-7 TaxID=3040600 RepID=UPI00244B0EFA|nr:hypothetical protein [Pokkaliibacter sp. MBI-7]MDH2431013.1 hypothetical protein [Pokkaliibacter sp. MBI-7]MDH2436708.1 hypothetical protein [Pokkaliibacter sp. MBI-7]MDH2436808.1 hypothetical protein [Pokkaliibacter sp. MBI-7]
MAELTQPMTQSQFLQLQDELDQRLLACAMGQETDDTDLRIAELHSLLDDAPWTLVPGEGCILKTQWDALFAASAAK